MPDKFILCFGDSNTHGQKPYSGQYERYTFEERWTVKLEQKLGSKFRIIEEGLCSRTIDLDDGENIVLNGLAVFGQTLASHRLIDWIIIMLGTNDTKAKFNQTPEKMLEGIKKYILLIQKFCPKSKVLLIAPAPVNEEIANNSFTPNMFFGAEKKTREFAVHLRKFAKEKNFKFLNLGDFAQVSEIDGIHFDLSEQEKIAEAVYNLINES